jgi:Bacterial Ig domain
MERNGPTLMTVRRFVTPAIGAAALLAALIPAGAPTFAASTSDCNGSLAVTLDNPNAGDVVGAGKYTLQGSAIDYAAGAGGGIDRVTVSLDARDQGGIPLGQATLGQPNANGFLLTVDLTNFSGAHTIEVRAHSSVSGNEAMVWAPVTIGSGAAGGPVLGEPPLKGCASAFAGFEPAAATAVAPAIDQGRLGAGNVPSIPDQSIQGVPSTGSLNWGD